MSAHTPGPWEVRQPHGDLETRWITPVATFGNGWLGGRYLSVSGIMHDEDAALIVAAPDLLEACMAALPRLAHNASCHSVRPTGEWAEHGSASFEKCDCEIKLVRAAIAKATGAAE